MKTRVMVVDNQISFRQMLGALLPREGAYEFVAEAGTGLEAIHLLATQKPDLVVLDLALPELNGVGLLQHLREEARATRTLVYCGTTHREMILEGLLARPHGFVLKREPWSAFQEALRMVNSGCSYFTRFVTRMLDEAGSARSGWTLTPREISVLQMVAEGRTNKEMARQLAISVKTVEHHRSHIMEKINLHDVAGLTRYAVRHGLVSLD
jgi:DNA-binding NarL/FixJ family response regulator